MAQVIGDVRRKATRGERRILELLRAFPNDYIVWPERHIDRHPDFIVFHPRLGVLVLEVKDWAYIETANPDRFVIRTQQGETFRAPNPYRETREKALAVADRLQEEPRLKHTDGSFQGKLILPWAYAIVFSRLTRMQLQWLGSVIEPEYVISEEDLVNEQQLETRIRRLPWMFPADLTPTQVDLVRRTIYPELKAPPSPLVNTAGVLDIPQEQAAKKGLQEYAGLPHVEAEPSQPFVRLLRGVAGSGKTLVLSLRARLLLDYHPDWRILVVTFNKALAERLRLSFVGFEEQIKVCHFHLLCKELLAEAGLWVSPVEDRAGRLAHVLNKLGYTDRLDIPFLQEEFEWIKESRIIDRDVYLEIPRTGRKKSLLKSEREVVYEVFEHYQAMLHRDHREDWAGIPECALVAMDRGDVPTGQYEAILIDEAQDFAPAWFEVLKRLLNPDTNVLFMAADSTQRIYRKFTWKSLGFNVVGRSRVLRRAYRSTYEIVQTAYELIRDDENLLRELRDEDEELLSPDLNGHAIQHGDYPILKWCPNPDAEAVFLGHEITRLTKFGYDPRDIVILCRQRAQVNACTAALRAQNIPVAPLNEDAGSHASAVSVGTLHSAKGLEYRVVFITRLDSLFQTNGTVIPADLATLYTDELRLLYVGMTRARERLYFTVQGKLPIPVQYLARFFDVESRHALNIVEI